LVINRFPGQLRPDSAGQYHRIFHIEVEQVAWNPVSDLFLNLTKKEQQILFELRGYLNRFKTDAGKSKQ